VYCLQPLTHHLLLLLLASRPTTPACLPGCRSHLLRLLILLLS
jgi:hypothetical protein